MSVSHRSLLLMCRTPLGLVVRYSVLTDFQSSSLRSQYSTSVYKECAGTFYCCGLRAQSRAWHMVRAHRICWGNANLRKIELPLSVTPSGPAYAQLLPLLTLRLPVQYQAQHFPSYLMSSKVLEWEWRGGRIWGCHLGRILLTDSLYRSELAWGGCV